MKKKDIRNYEIRQKNWIKTNNLELGDKVIMNKSHSSYSKGWNMPWIPEIDNYIGKQLEVIYIHPTMGIELKLPTTPFYTYVYVPYTILQKVENYYWVKPKEGNYEWEKYPIEMFQKKNPNYSYSFVNPYE